MAKYYGVPLHIRPLFPMVMRGLAVPQVKGSYILQDMARESDTWGFPFRRKGGWMDPLWEPTFRFFAVWPQAVRLGCEAAFTSAFAHGVYCEGLDFGTDAGLRQVVGKVPQMDV